MSTASILGSAIASDRAAAAAGRHAPSRAWRVPLLLAVLLAGAPAQGAEVYQTPEEFLRESFGGAPPAPALLWLAGDLREQARAILGHEPAALRTRYWRAGRRTAWVLEEVGKEEPITVGLSVVDGRLDQLRVLIYRETRGWEVRLDFFTRQFRGAGLAGEQRLDRSIDNISGATLSVNAVRKLAQLALVFHAQVMASVSADGSP